MEFNRYHPQLQRCMETAAGLAELMGCPQLHGPHVLLAAIGEERGLMDRLFRLKLQGTTAETVEESLRGILEIEGAELENPSGIEAVWPDEWPLSEKYLDASAVELLRRSEAVAADWGLDLVPVRAVLYAGLQAPPPQLTEVLRDLGLTETAFSAVLPELTPESAAASAAIEIFRDGVLHWNSFGPVANAALRLLAPLARERRLSDKDLLYGFFRCESWLVDAIHLWGLPLAGMRSTLAAVVGHHDGGHHDGAALPLEQIGRLLQQILQEAAQHARRDGRSIVSESDLLRAHMDRVGASSGNIFLRLGIDTRRLREFLDAHPEDRETAAHDEDAADAGNAVRGAAQDAAQDIEGYLRSRVIHQERAVTRAAQKLRLMRTGLGAKGRPVGTFLFLGATGVGKTELARAMADVAFGLQDGMRDAHMIRIDCGNYHADHSIAGLLGAPAGYLGHGTGAVLLNQLAQKPRSVILFDEAEKAHPSIWQRLLPLFDEGVVQGLDGTVRDATGCILVLTSNRGYKEAAARFDVWNRDWDEVADKMEDFLWDSLRGYLSPEFLGRIDREDVIFFNHFARDDFKLILLKNLHSFIEEMQDKGIAVEIEDLNDGSEVVEVLTDLAWQQRMDGARCVRGLINNRMREPMSVARVANPKLDKVRFVARTGDRSIVLET